jgi:hypothetical protein
MLLLAPVLLAPRGCHFGDGDVPLGHDEATRDAGAAGDAGVSGSSSIGGSSSAGGSSILGEAVRNLAYDLSTAFASAGRAISVSSID